MLFTTFLLTTAAGAAVVQGAMLLRRKPDVAETKIPYALMAVAATVAGLVGLGLVMS